MDSITFPSLGRLGLLCILERLSGSHLTWLRVGLTGTGGLGEVTDFKIDFSESRERNKERERETDVFQIIFLP